jgi:hypothetical protein
MTQDSREQLEAFVDKAATVERSAYLKKIKTQGGTKVNLRYSDGEFVEMTDNFPDEEAINALVLTARLFIQKNDKVSIRRMADLENDPDISDEWKERYSDARDLLNTVLDSPGMVKIGEKHYTAREIFDVFLYGALAHTEKAQSDLYNLWLKTPVFKLLESEFHLVVQNLLNTVGYLAHYSRMELDGKAIPPISHEPEVRTGY